MRCTGCRAASRGARNPISGSCERSAIVYQSHRIWQSNGSAAHVGPVRGTTGWRAVALSDCPSQTGSPSAAPGCFCSQITANAVIARSEIRGLIHVRDPNHGEAPGRSVQSRIFHLFHVFYQVQIRLSSPTLRNRGRGPTTSIIARESGHAHAITLESLVLLTVTYFC
jgi:hypothetical protein